MDGSKEAALENGSSISEGLRSVSNTVEKLSFALEYYPYIGYYYPNLIDHLVREEFIGFLKPFARMSSVEVPITLPLGPDPRQLRMWEAFYPTHCRSFVFTGIFLGSCLVRGTVKISSWILFGIC